MELYTRYHFMQTKKKKKKQLIFILEKANGLSVLSEEILRRYLLIITVMV